MASHQTNYNVLNLQRRPLIAWLYWCSEHATSGCHQACAMATITLEYTWHAVCNKLIPQCCLIKLAYIDIVAILNMRAPKQHILQYTLKPAFLDHFVTKAIHTPHYQSKHVITQMCCPTKHTITAQTCMYTYNSACTYTDGSLFSVSFFFALNWVYLLYFEKSWGSVKLALRDQFLWWHVASIHQTHHLAPSLYIKEKSTLLSVPPI